MLMSSVHGHLTTVGVCRVQPLRTRRRSLSCRHVGFKGYGQPPAAKCRHKGNLVNTPFSHPKPYFTSTPYVPQKAIIYRQ